MSPPLSVGVTGLGGLLPSSPPLSPPSVFIVCLKDQTSDILGLTYFHCLGDIVSFWSFYVFCRSLVRFILGASPAVHEIYIACQISVYFAVTLSRTAGVLSLAPPPSNTPARTLILSLNIPAVRPPQGRGPGHSTWGSCLDLEINDCIWPHLFDASNKLEH